MKSGRKLKEITKQRQEIINQIVKENPKIGITDLLRLLENQGIKCSRPTLYSDLENISMISEEFSVFEKDLMKQLKKNIQKLKKIIETTENDSIKIQSIKLLGHEIERLLRIQGSIKVHHKRKKKEVPMKIEIAPPQVVNDDLVWDKQKRNWVKKNEQSNKKEDNKIL